MKMRFGEFKGKLVDDVPIKYLVWMLSRDNLRFKYWPEMKEALRILRTRGFDNILADLRVDTPPPVRRLTTEEVDKRKVEKAEKLRQLEQRRAEEKERRRAERRAARMKEEMEMQAAFIRSRRGEPPPTVIVDASLYVAQARQQLVDQNDVSDLI